jgi:hypothetical protein
MEAVTQPFLHYKNDPIECLLYFSDFELNIKATILDSDSTKLARSTSFDPKVLKDFNILESQQFKCSLF